jgi:hypothetical protein
MRLHNQSGDFDGLEWGDGEGGRFFPPPRFLDLV